MSEATVGRRGFSGKQVLLFVLLAVLLTAGLTYWYLRVYVFPAEFTPVSLTPTEQVELDGKLREIGLDPVDLMPDAQRTPDALDADGRLIPERYFEDASKRVIHLSEKELNALIANNADLARRFAIDLSDDLASSKLLIPVDPGIPVLGGRTLRVTTGLEISYQQEKPVVVLKGVSVMGIPIPNAWLGNLKNVDLVEEFGGQPGFWRTFAAGVESIEIADGTLDIALKE